MESELPSKAAGTTRRTASALLGFHIGVERSGSRPVGRSRIGMPTPNQKLTQH